MAKILIVDDEQRVCDSLVALLSSKGEHHVEAAATVREAREIAERQPLDLLIVDLMLADEIDGLQLATSLRDSNPTLPVILVTGYLSDDVQARVDALPQTWALAKPCTIEELIRTIDVTLGLHHND
jgi:DNA-binding response OmpR family regulator